MNKATFELTLFSISLDRNSLQPMHAQLVHKLRQYILSGRIPPGAKLPSSRKFAQELSVSRITISTAMDQLISEGYANGVHGSGVYVARNLPDYEPNRDHAPQGPKVSEPETHDAILPFEAAFPDLQNFPYREWVRCFDTVWRDPDDHLLVKSHSLGLRELRIAIAEHLKVWRDIDCSADQICVTSGLTEAVSLVKVTLIPMKRLVHVFHAGCARAGARPAGARRAAPPSGPFGSRGCAATSPAPRCR